MNDLLDIVRTESRNLPGRELLSKPARVLLGVTEAAETALESLEIKSVFDLATSGVFEAATKLFQAGTDLRSALYQHGSPTTDLIRNGSGAGKKVNELQFMPISALQSIPDGHGDEIATALDAKTIRDLALYPPYRAARDLLESLFFPDNVPGVDPERPADLLPRNGDYPTERVQYTTLFMDTVHAAGDAAIIDVTSDQFKPIDLAGLAAIDAGFQHVALGALLTFNQSWYAQGVTLGQLLHSTSLAPGESTRIAVVDWSRKSRAGETEVIAEADDITNDSTHNRSISEVTSAVADEAQGGFSHTNAQSNTSQEGTATAAEMSAPLGGLFGGPSGSVGHTTSDSSTTSQADSYSTSWGHRQLGSAMLQNVNDRTHQHAHSARNRRASVVKEVSQSEHENVSTRVLANYNHMHALTIQYYEVVQVYRVEVAVEKADRAVFIPVALADFANDAVIRRFQLVLANAALTFDVREALVNLDVLEVAPVEAASYAAIGRPLNAYVKEAMVSRTSLAAAGALSVRPALAAKHLVSTATEEAAAAVPTPGPTASTATEAATATAAPSDSRSLAQQVTAQLWNSDQASRLAGLMNRAVHRPNSASLYLPTDVMIEGGSVASGGTPVRIIFHTLAGAAIDDVSSEQPLAMSDLDQIAVVGSSTERDLPVTVTLTVSRNGVRFPVQLPSVIVPKGEANEVSVVRVRARGVSTNLKQHFAAHRLYYSQAIFRSLDASQIALLLAPYGITVGGNLVPVAQVVEPNPISYVGNYLVFKMNSDAGSDDTWAAWLTNHGIELGVAREDLVPLPSGGTFAEAVLGRSNSAEKLDITRFWNWQDSPPPLQPTEIAAVSTASRALQEDVTPGQLSNPIINITAPTSLPDPTGTAAVLAAIQNGSMFRDMSGLQGTIGLAQSALQATAAGAATAGQQAGTNMNNLLQANTERQRIAAEMITSLAKTAASMYTGGAAGGGGGGISPGSGHSQDGAKINYFDKAQNQNPAAAPSANGVNGATAPVGSGGHSSNGNGAAASNGVASGGAPSYSQNPAALAATWGDTQSRSDLVDGLVDRVGTVVPAASPAELAGSTNGANQSVSVHYDLDLVAQPTKLSCWAASLAMLVGYHRHQSISADAIVNEASVAIGNPFTLRQTLASSQFVDVINYFNCKPVSLPSNLSFVPSPEEWRTWLEQHGPLWVTVDGVPSHAIVVRGIAGDMTPDGTTIEVLNPWDESVTFDGDQVDFHPANYGLAQTQSYRAFASNFGNVGLADYGNWRVRYI